MAEYKELIKNFDKIRDYIRDFFVYGFKSRNDYAATIEIGTEPKKSGRTYDNERRRIESWLGAYINSAYSHSGKQIAISVNSSDMSVNPLYAAWKSKSFTDNDIMLHFFLLDYLSENSMKNAGEICDELSDVYGIAFDTQTVRKKLNEYVSLGLFISKREGKQLLYGLLPDPDWCSEFPNFSDALRFFQEASPFGFIGSTIMDKYQIENDIFRFKHAFIVHTLEDQILLESLQAIQKGQRIAIGNQNKRSHTITQYTGIPLKIFVSTQTGRRYLCFYNEDRKRFVNMRLDSIKKISRCECIDNYIEIKQKLEKNIAKCWGVSFGNDSRGDSIEMKVYVNENTDNYILKRLEREGRGGNIEKLAEHTYQYVGEFFDTNEMLTFVKSFTGRIISLKGTNAYVIQKFYCDMKRMKQLYLKEERDGIIL